MLKEISWQEYFVFISVTLLLYYAFLFIFYFRMDFSSLLKANSRFFFRGNEIKSQVNGNAHKVIEEIWPCFQGKQNLHELIFDLQAKLEPYKYWDELDFRKSINNFIIKESANKCSIHLGEEDLRVLWL